jgi:hypothetical protein
MSFDDTVSVIHVCLSKSSELQRNHPPTPLPSQCFAGGGVVALFSARSCEFDYDFEAVRFRVKNICIAILIKRSI